LWQIFTFKLEDVEVLLKRSFTFLAINEFLAYIWAHIYIFVYTENFLLCPRAWHMSQKY